MKAGIVGLPNVGKSTLFNCLSNVKAQSANFPFCTIEPNIGLVNIPDERLNKLVDLISPEKVVPNSVEIVDIAGLVKGASKGEGLGNQFLSNIRETNAIIHVLRCYEDDNITHVEGSVDPLRDKEIIEFELKLKDIETLNKRKEKISRAAKTGDKKSINELKTLDEILKKLNNENYLNIEDFKIDDLEFVKSMSLLSLKPVLFVCNISENDLKSQNNNLNRLIDKLNETGSKVIVMAIKTEEEINDLDNYEDRKLFLDDLGLEEPGSSRLIRETHELLNLSTFYTAGKKEVRAWTFKKGLKAPRVAGIIHSDFEKGFIKAEVIKFDDYINFGSELKVKEAGKLKTEGKEYVIIDGDIVNFRFNT
tara:strand:+ start:373 stop:1464 length:1092 start_codon:yes stop_codon:yes gene_type:complete